MSDLRAASQQALDTLNLVSDEGESKFPGTIQGAISDLEAALQQGADPTDPGHDVAVLREHVRHLERRVRELHTQQLPLTGERLKQIELGLRIYYDNDKYDLSLHDLARAIEKAHGIGGDE